MMLEEIEPYVMSIDFGELQELPDGNWVSSALVEIASRIKPSPVVPTRGNLLGEECFTYHVCSVNFKQNPTDEYKRLPDVLHARDKFDINSEKARINEFVSKIGVITVKDFTDAIYPFFESENWAYNIKLVSDNSSKKWYKFWVKG